MRKETFMQRSEFLKKLMGFLGLLGVSAGSKAYDSPDALDQKGKKLYVLSGFVKGFQYQKADDLLEVMQPGEPLELQREPQNQYDAHAIAIYYAGKKIGYVARVQNKALSNLMDAGILIPEAEIAYVEKCAAPWENIHFAVVAYGKPDKSVEHLRVVQKPEYKSLIQGGDDFYNALVRNSSNNSIYSVIHESFPNGYEFNNAVNDSRILVNTAKLPIRSVPSRLVKNRLKVGDYDP
ncbi:HIRAN domain-containing protein [Cytophagaceae bacterium ABcell3]|nr:HIRAN domain-containing protein [Cytophagaceae bacterium ABcell3]